MTTNQTKQNSLAELLYNANEIIESRKRKSVTTTLPLTAAPQRPSRDE